LHGVIPGQNVSVIAVQPHGAGAIELTYKTAEGDLGQRVLGRDAEGKFAIADAEARPFDAVAADFKLVAECQRIKLAGLSDPMLAVTTSDIQPLPHQLRLRAVYGELLPRAPLRFLLADDPGAGKTIMAGLYIKELILREDVKRCLVVAPGGLVDQWQDELYLKFGLAFRAGRQPAQHPLLIARMDQLAIVDPGYEHGPSADPRPDAIRNRRVASAVSSAATRPPVRAAPRRSASEWMRATCAVGVLGTRPP
jgi:hypothetical protein